VIDQSWTGNDSGRPYAPENTKKRSALPLQVLLGVLVAVFLASLAVNGATIGSVVLALFFGAIFLVIAPKISPPEHAHWLPTAIAAGFVAKMVASGARYWVLINLYRGVGDATGYHSKGLRAADVWRSLSVPEFGTGSDFIAPATGLLYVPYKPTLLGGFFIFATLAFVGQLFMLFAFRHVASPLRFKWYSAGILFMPTILYWPSSVGKEALMFLFIGPVAYGAARLLTEYRLRWGIPIVIGLVGAGVVRAHVALLLAGALAFSVAAARAPRVTARLTKRILLLGAVGVVMVGALFAVSARFGLDFSAVISADVLTEEIDPFLSDVSDRTDTGGSAVEGSIISSPADVPEALLRVLFRPLPWEATNAQALVASLEGGLLLAVSALRLPAIVMNLRYLRRRSYAVYSLVYTAGFIYAFSAMVNLGILARQRSQVMPFLLAFLADMGIRDRVRKNKLARLEASPKIPAPVG
jgi:hypothetical protein